MAAMNFNKLNFIILISIICITIAITCTLFQTATVIIFQFYNFEPTYRTIENENLQVKDKNSLLWHMGLSASRITSNGLDKLKKEENKPRSKNYVMVLDFWERMVNVQSGLRRLVQLGVDANFTVVEPYVYGSKISLPYSFPEHFQYRNIIPQPASLYYRTKDFYNSKHYTNYDEIKNNFRVQIVSKNSSRQFRKLSNPSEPVIIQAAVVIDWNGLKQKGKRKKRRNIFFWCDRELKKMGIPRSRYGFKFSKEFHVQRGVCLDAEQTMYPSEFRSDLFQRLYQFVRNGTRQLNRVCEDCNAIAFVNYRKHLFGGFVSSIGGIPFSQKTLPLHVGEFPRMLAKRVQETEFKGKRYVALQIRTGKPFSLFRKYERQQVAKGKHVTHDTMFEKWLKVCIRQIAAQVRKARRELGGRAGVYVASDMFNNGWNGGEICTPRVCTALDRARETLSKELGDIKVFNPAKYGISQDSMGIASATDAAMCADADRFVYATPSNFGKWVDEQRMVVGNTKATIAVDCMERIFHEAKT